MQQSSTSTSHIWDTSMGKQYTSVLNKLQKKAIRIISNVGYRDHTEPQFKNLNILKLENIYKTTLLKFYFNYCHKLLPSYFNCLELTP